MTLYDYIYDPKNRDEEITVWDKDYDTEVYFYVANNPDTWDEAMNKIASKLEIVDYDKNGVTVNLSDVIEENLPNFEVEELFIHNDVDSIMETIDLILAGGVSENWITRFANSLQ
jgi:hypothetical protein